MSEQQEPERLEDDIPAAKVQQSEPTGPETPEASAAGTFRSQVNQPAHDRRHYTVFEIGDHSFHPSPLKTSHWSVPWSDLMMTMFILFLTMFVYQTAHKQLLITEETEVVGGESTGAVDVAPEHTPAVPFAPIKPSLPLITGGTIKKVVPIHVYDIDEKTKFLGEKNHNQMERITQSVQKTPTPPSGENVLKRQQTPDDFASEPETGLLTDRGLPPARNLPPTPENEQIGRILKTINDTITTNNLNKYATADLANGTQVRISLKSDLFFAAGAAELTTKSMASLQKIGAALKDIRFMIEVVGHTDNQPLRADRFPSNWELSVGRASSVARFFIEETGMNPNQFAVSGYASYRPLYPNSTAENRAANRRIEVLISDKYPKPVMAEKKQ